VKVSISKARELLLKKGQGEATDIQLNKLSLLSPHESLVIFHAIKPCWGINITYHDKVSGKLIYQRIRELGMPLFYLQEESLQTLQVQIKKHELTAVTEEKELKVVKYRCDKLLEETPYLPSIHAFRQKIKTI
jgi:hypothetical protein